MILRWKIEINTRFHKLTTNSSDFFIYNFVSQDRNFSVSKLLILIESWYPIWLLLNLKIYTWTLYQMDHKGIYRVTHKEWDFRDDSTQFIQRLFPYIYNSLQLITLFDKSLNKPFKAFLQDRRFNSTKKSSYFESSSLQSNPVWVTLYLKSN